MNYSKGSLYVVNVTTVAKWSCSIIILFLSLCFNSHFPGEPGLAGVYWSKGWWRWWWQLDHWSYKSCKAPVKSSPPTNQHPVFYRPDALPVTQPTVSKHWREKYLIPWTCLPQAHMGVFQLCLWPLIAPGCLGGGLPCLSSALWCQYPKYHYLIYYLVFINSSYIHPVQHCTVDTGLWPSNFCSICWSLPSSILWADLHSGYCSQGLVSWTR